MHFTNHFFIYLVFFSNLAQDVKFNFVYFSLFLIVLTICFLDYLRIAPYLSINQYLTIEFSVLSVIDCQHLF